MVLNWTKVNWMVTVRHGAFNVPLHLTDPCDGNVTSSAPGAGLAFLLRGQFLRDSRHLNKKIKMLILTQFLNQKSVSQNKVKSMGCHVISSLII